MAILAKKIHIKNSAGTEQTVALYSTTGEVATAASYTYQSVDGTTCYAPLVSTSHAKATSGRVLKGGTTYAWGSTAPAPAYATWTKNAAGSGTFTVPSGITKLRVTCVGGGAGGGLFQTDTEYEPHNALSTYVNGAGAIDGAATTFGSVTAAGANRWVATATNRTCTASGGEGTVSYKCTIRSHSSVSTGTTNGVYNTGTYDYQSGAPAVPLTDYKGATVFSAGAGGCSDGHDVYRCCYTGASGYKKVSTITVTPGQVISWSIGRRSKGWRINDWCSSSCSSAGRNACAGEVGGILVEYGAGIE